MTKRRAMIKFAAAAVPALFFPSAGRGAPAERRVAVVYFSKTGHTSSVANIAPHLARGDA